MKIYTRTGDSGDTGLFDGTRVQKSDPRVAAYGDIDELNAWLGLVVASTGLLMSRRAPARVRFAPALGLIACIGTGVAAMLVQAGTGPVLSMLAGFLDKVDAIHCGADGYFEKPLDWEAMMRRLLHLLERSGPVRRRILSVDDDPAQSAYLRVVLESGGYEVCVCVGFWVGICARSISTQSFCCIATKCPPA